MTSRGHWTWVGVSAQQEAEAKRIRSERDRLYGNIYQEVSGDERWVGDLGEIVFDLWSRGKAGDRFSWIRDDAAGKADFISDRNVSIGVKAVKRKGPPRPGYTAQITAKHADEPVDQFFFMSYEIAIKRMWLLGGIDRLRFLKESRYYSAGEEVHSHYVIRQGHEIYNIEIERLVHPEKWLQAVL